MLQENELISIIIPVYNAEKYISVCLESLIVQTRPNFEIIIVVDGSPDNSLALCEEYARRDARIRVLWQENLGVSVARNTGLSHANGAYIAFVDPDDYVKEDYFEVLYRDALENDADVVCCDFVELLDGKPVSLTAPKVRNKRRVTEPDAVYQDMAAFQEFYWSCVWGKLIRADLAKSHSFPPSLRMGEDQVYMFDVLSGASVVYLDDYQGYYYVRTAESVTMNSGEYSVSRRMDELEMNRHKLEGLPQVSEELRGKFFYQYALSVQALINAVLISGRMELVSLVKKYAREVLNSGYSLPGKNRAHLMLFLCAPRLYQRWIKYRTGM